MLKVANPNSYITFDIFRVCLKCLILLEFSRCVFLNNTSSIEFFKMVYIKTL